MGAVCVQTEAIPTDCGPVCGVGPEKTGSKTWTTKPVYVPERENNQVVRG